MKWLTTVSMRLESSPSRGTWIEIPGFLRVFSALGVVPLTGDVD